MFFLYVAIGLLVFTGLCWQRYYANKAKGETTNYDSGGVVLIAIAVFLVAIGFVATGVEYVSQVDDFENVKKFQKVELIYQDKAGVLTQEFAKYLAEKYPKHEKDIFNKISPDKVGLYLVKYPELRASDTMLALVSQINKLQSDVYDQRVKVEQALQQTRVRLRNPWLFTFFIPTQ